MVSHVIDAVRYKRGKCSVDRKPLNVSETAPKFVYTCLFRLSMGKHNFNRRKIDQSLVISSARLVNMEKRLNYN